MFAGNHILPDEDLYSFYIELLSRADPSKPAKVNRKHSNFTMKKQYCFVVLTHTALTFI